MSDEKMRELLSVLPEEDEIAEGAARARRRAMARLEEPAPARRWGWVWAPAMVVLAGLVVAGLWMRQARRVETMAVQPPTPRIESPALVPLAHARGSVSAVGALPSRDRKGAAGVATLGQPRLELHLVLSDGTRVQWILDKDFSL